MFSDPPEVSPREPVVHAKVGWSVNLTCNVWANPPPSIRWFSSYSSKELTENSQIIERKVSMAHNSQWLGTAAIQLRYTIPGKWKFCYFGSHNKAGVRTGYFQLFLWSIKHLGKGRNTIHALRYKISKVQQDHSKLTYSSIILTFIKMFWKLYFIKKFWSRCVGPTKANTIGKLRSFLTKQWRQTAKVPS